MKNPSIKHVLIRERRNVETNGVLSANTYVVYKTGATRHYYGALPETVSNWILNRPCEIIHEKIYAGAKYRTILIKDGEQV